MKESRKTKKKKTVIEAKTRLLLEIALHGVEDTPDYLKKPKILYRHLEN